MSHASVTYRRREVTNPVARKLVIVISVTVAAIVLPLGILWLAFWGLATLPFHIALRAAGGKGFLRDDNSYVVPWWAMLLFALIVTAPITLGAIS